MSARCTRRKGYGRRISREYPELPVAAVGVVVVRGDGRVLLARRANPPAQGLWSLPGGRMELGETVAEAARREVFEECGVRCEPLEVFHTVDRIFRDPEGRVRYHYVIIEVLAHWVSGQVLPGSDALEVGWFDLEQLPELDITPGVYEVALALLERHPDGVVDPGRRRAGC